MTNHHEEPAPLPAPGRRVHHSVGRSGGHIRACPYSLVGVTNHNRPRQALARHPTFLFFSRPSLLDRKKLGRIFGPRIQHTVRDTELAPDRFKNFWRD